MSTKQITSPNQAIQEMDRVEKIPTISSSISTLSPKGPWMRLLLVADHIREFGE